MVESIGKRIRRARMWRGVGQAELARAIGLSPTSLSLIENAQVKDPRSSIVQRIAQELQVSADFLLGFSDEMERKAQAA
jgi:transcriptional regulator with XRE-family HTH domain